MIELKQRNPDLPIEYGCKFWRILPWDDPRSSDRGAAMAILEPNTSTTPHSHSEIEVFFVVRGAGHIRVGDERREISTGDVIRVKSGLDHVLENTSSEVMEVLCSWFPAEGSG